MYFGPREKKGPGEVAIAMNAPYPLHRAKPTPLFREGKQLPLAMGHIAHSETGCFLVGRTLPSIGGTEMCTESRKAEAPRSLVWRPARPPDPTDGF